MASRFAVLTMAFGSLSAVVSGACSPSPVTRVTWTGLEEGEIKRRLDSPSADLSLALEAATVSDLEARMPALVEVSRFLAHVMGAVTEVAQTDYKAEEEELPELEEAPGDEGERRWGTNLYLRLACPGLDFVNRTTDFSAGEVRIDSARLRSLSLQGLLDSGEFLLSFKKCLMGSVHLDAELPGRFTAEVSRLRSGASDTDAPALGIAVAADQGNVQSSGTPLGMLMVGCGGSGACDDDLRVAAEFKTGAGSFVVTFRALRSFWAGGELSLRIDGADSSAECSYAPKASLGARLSCD